MGEKDRKTVSEMLDEYKNSILKCRKKNPFQKAIIAHENGKIYRVTVKVEIIGG